MVDLERRVRLLTLSTAASWLLLGFVVLGGVAGPPTERLAVTELDAERVRILNPEGEPVMIIANRERMGAARMNGRAYAPELIPERAYQSGIIFYNDEGDEVGGLVYAGVPLTDSTHWANGQLTFDQWKQNQVVALQYVENARTRRAGLRVYDRPDDVSVAEQFDLGQAMLDADDDATRDSLRAALRAFQAHGAGVERMFVGSQDEVAQVLLRDPEGRPRARLYVDPAGEARLEFLDEAGATVAAYPR